MIFLQIVREVELHRDLKHKHVVEFHSYFEDDENVYIVLENCPRKVRFLFSFCQQNDKVEQKYWKLHKCP